MTMQVVSKVVLSKYILRVKYSGENALSLLSCSNSKSIVTEFEQV